MKAVQVIGPMRDSHLLKILAIWLSILILSGAESATYLHTPDSEFYFTLIAFGDDITDRAPTDAYFWTKLGAILPARGLVMAFGPMVGLEAYRAILLLMIVTAAYSVVPTGGSQSTRVAVAYMLGLNTVILGFLGDTYVTGSGLAGMCAFVVLALKWADSRYAWTHYPIVLGLLLGWLTMINPYFAVLGAAVLIGLILARPVRSLSSWKAIVASAFSTAGAATLAVLFWVRLGGLVFPGLDWLQTLRNWNATLNMAIYRSPNLDWLPTETALFVPFVCGAVALTLCLVHRDRPVLRYASAVALAPIVMAILYVTVRPGSTFELSAYNAMLWPGALLGLGLSLSALAPFPSRDNASVGAREWALTALGCIAVLLAGYWSRDLGRATGFLLAGVVSVVAVALGCRWVTRSIPVAIVTICLCAASFQVLQNGRPIQGGGVNWRVDYSSSYYSNNAQSLLRRDFRVQEWIIASTDDADRILVWSDLEQESLSAAAMSFWGWNTVSNDSSLSEMGEVALRNVDPTIVVTYGTTPDAQEEIVTRLRKVVSVADPDCREFEGIWVCIYPVEAPVPQ